MAAGRPWAPHAPVTEQTIMVHQWAGKLTLGSDDLDSPTAKVKFEPDLKVSMFVSFLNRIRIPSVVYRFIGNNSGIPYLHDRMHVHRIHSRAKAIRKNCWGFSCFVSDSILCKL